MYVPENRIDTPLNHHCINADSSKEVLCEVKFHPYKYDGSPIKVNWGCNLQDDISFYLPNKLGDMRSVIPNRSDGTFRVILRSCQHSGLSARCISDMAWQTVSIFKDISSDELEFPVKVFDASATTRHICEDIFEMSIEDYVILYLKHKHK